MPAPRVAVLRAPGTNCDVETAFAFDRAGGKAERLHVFRLLEQPRLLNEFQILCIPGGFSYGDNVGAGVIFGQALRSRLAATLGEFLQGDRLVLGICNGFQVLMRAGILPGGAAAWPPSAESIPEATLTWNDNGRYTACWVRLAADSRRCVFLRGLEHFDLPVAHGEGKIVVRDPATLTQWRDTGRIALSYCPPDSAARESGTQTLPFPQNPNGSMANIAGLCDESGRVMGLMPHPERHIHPLQHPQWTRRGLHSDEADGLRLFRNAVGYFV